MGKDDHHYKPDVIEVGIAINNMIRDAQHSHLLMQQKKTKAELLEEKEKEKEKAGILHEPIELYNAKQVVRKVGNIANF